MNADAGRRAFVRNMAMGVPVLAGAAAIPSMAIGSPVVVPNLSTFGDARIERVLRQLGTLHNDMVGRTPTVEDARVVGSYLRALATYRRESSVDVELSSHMRTLVGHVGRPYLSTATPNPAPALAGLARLGVSAPSLEFGTLSPEARLPTIEALLRDGAAGLYEASAAVVAGLQDDPSTWCQVIESLKHSAEVLAAIMCLAAQLSFFFAPECVSANLLLAVLTVLGFITLC